MPPLSVFTDGSVNTQTHIGYGAYLIVPEAHPSVDVLKQHVQVKRFEETSSSKLELQTLLWALEDIQCRGNRLTVYTDSQNIMGLQERRDRLEASEYRSKKNKPLHLYELYQEFYRMTDDLNCEFIKVNGHQVSTQKDQIDQMFTLVDRASRKALREEYRVIQ